jgi:hypothetical protein
MATRVLGLAAAVAFPVATVAHTSVFAWVLHRAALEYIISK